MSMELLYEERDIHSRSVSAIGYNPSRREVLLGFEDGMFKIFEAETGSHVATVRAHQGWITSFTYWPKVKMNLSASHDTKILFWSGNTMTDKVYIDEPVYSIIIDFHRHSLVCGTSSGIKLYELDDDRECGSYVKMNSVRRLNEHTDVVKCLASLGSRIYSGGFDQRLIIYDSAFTGEHALVPFSIVSRAHDAGITQLITAKEYDNAWIFTGSFDKTVKIWTADGKIIHRLTNFSYPISSVCYIPRNKTVWITCGMPYAYVYDPKSGECVSDYCDTFMGKENERYTLQILEYYPDMSLVIGSSSRRSLLVWKYYPSCSTSILKNSNPMEALTYTSKPPILIFSGDSKGELTKWERRQANIFSYMTESLKTGESMRKLLKKKQIAKQRELELKSIATGKPIEKNRFQETSEPQAFLRLKYLEELDFLIAACEDGNIYVFGFDESAVDILLDMKSSNEQAGTQTDAGSVVGSEASSEASISDHVTKRVAGFICRSILMEHNSIVTCFAIVPPESDRDNFYLVSGGWDQRLCIWDLETGDLVDVFRDPKSRPYEEREIAADDVILDMVYAKERNELAYSSADNIVYIRRFSPVGSKMRLINTLKGHESEVPCVCWEPDNEFWITASDDQTIRIWSGSGMNDCLKILHTGGPTHSMFWDHINEVVVAAIDCDIKVFDIEDLTILQTNSGHSDEVKCVIYIPENGQYVSASRDGQINVWAAWRRPRTTNKSQAKSQSRRSEYETIEPLIVTVEEEEDEDPVVEPDDPESEVVCNDVDLEEEKEPSGD